MYNMVPRVNNTVLYTWNLLRDLILNVLTMKIKRYLYEVMDVLINLIVIIISQLYIYQITTLYTLNMCNFLSVIPK